MRWQERIADSRLESGNLEISGDKGVRENSRYTSLTETNLREIVEAVRSGVPDSRGIEHQVTSLTLNQVNLPRNNRSFQEFIQALLGISHFRSLDFGMDSTFSYVLTQSQTGLLTTAVAQAQHLTTLKVKVPDNSTSSNLLADMIRQNQSLISFSCDITDDTNNHAIVKAAIMTANRLREVNLLYTAEPSSAEFLVPPSKIANRNLTITFEGGKELKTSSLLALNSISLTGQKRKRDSDQGPSGDDEENLLSPPAKLAKLG